MNTSTNPTQQVRTRASLAMLIISALVFATSGAIAGPKTVTIVPPNAKYHGKTYSEWHAAFWQWSLALPLEGHPFLDTPEFDFSAGQSGSVWFVGGPDGPITRHVRLPSGKALFLTLRDVETSTLEEAPFFGATEAEQRSNSVWFADHICGCVLRH